MRATVLVRSLLLLLLVGLQNDDACSKTVQRSAADVEPGAASEYDEEPEAESQSTGDADGPDLAAGMGEQAEEEPDGLAGNNSSVSEGSRSVGGAPAGRPPNWLAGSWFQTPKKNSDVFGGFMVRLNDYHVLTHKDNCFQPQYQYLNLGDRERKNARTQIALSLDPKMNAGTGPAGPGRLIGCEFEGGHMLENGRDMGIFKLNHQREWAPYNFMQDHGKLKDLPPLQHDPSVKDDCHLHSYSGNTNPAAGQSGLERTFTKFQVNRGACKGSICSFGSLAHWTAPRGSAKAGAVCGGFDDSAAPILCGKEQKLSFLTIGRLPGEEACGNQFDALRVADHHTTISKYLNKTNVGPGMPSWTKKQNCDITNPFDIKPSC